MDRKLRQATGKLEVGRFEQGHAVPQFAHLASKARCPYSPVAGCISSRMHLEPDHVGATPARSGTMRRAGAGLSCSSMRALGVKSQMSVQPRGRMHLESRGRSARTRWRGRRVKVGQLQAAPLMLELGLAARARGRQV
jgi:hypothetical protein